MMKSTLALPAFHFWQVCRMQLKLFKTLWGYNGSYADAVQCAKEQGYDGIEGPVPASLDDCDQFAELLQQHNMAYIAEVATTGTFVPDRKLPPDNHLQDLEANVQRLQKLRPLFITCLGGCDAWEISDSIAFLRRAIDIAAEADLHISFETHRGRIFFNPWTTQRILQVIPSLKLTCDFSHWCVVCEGLQDTEADIIQTLLPNAWHIHGRIGYDQGAQVADPRMPLFENELQSHMQWWQWIWEAHRHNGLQHTTVTPEFGYDGYEYRDTMSGMPLIDAEEINRWLASVLRERFAVADAGPDDSMHTLMDGR